MVNDYQQSAFIVIKHNNTCNGEIIFYLFTNDDKISDILKQMVRSIVIYVLCINLKCIELG